ncbi:hypothetical protein JW905_00690 [bacterium]|nr:hypothetical protein [candidate division CSSED10-310 bacterium]
MKRYTLSAILCLVLIPTGFARWHSLGGPEDAAPRLEVIESGAGRIVVDVSLPGFNLDEIKTPRGWFHAVTLPGHGATLEVGKPAVPRIDIRLAVPHGCTPTAGITRLTSQTLTGITVIPAQPQKKDGMPPTSFSIDDACYDSPAACPTERIVVSPPRIWRDISLVELTVHPFRNAPAERLLECASFMRIELTWPGDVALGPITCADTGGFLPQYRAAILNFDSLEPIAATTRDEPLRLLIIAHDPLLAAIQPLADWHQRTGRRTEVVPASAAGGTSAALKAFIQDYYSQEHIEQVLLVGDIAQVPMCTVQQGSDTGIGDHDYSCLAGSDYYPEISIGRFHTSTASELSHMVQKTLNYTLDPPLDGWLDKSMLCAHEQEYPNKYTYCKNEILGYTYSLVTPQFDTFYPPEGASHAGVIAAIEAGRNLVNYRGHGDVGEWSWNLGWDNSDIYALNNGPHTPIVWNIACLNGAVDSGSECLTEAWLKAGDDGQGGAVASLAATRSSYTTPNHDFDKKLYRSIYDEGTYLIGDVVNAAKVAILPTGDYGIFNARIYFINGDPALHIYTRTPAEPVVTHNPTLPMGGGDFQVIVREGATPVSGADVCLWKGDENFLATAVTDETGIAVLPLNLTAVGEILLTVTAHDLLPYTATLAVEPAGCGAVQLDRAFYNCTDSVRATVWDADLNLSPVVIDSAAVTVSSDSEPAGEQLTLLETGPDTAAFIGFLQLSETNPGAGFLLVSHGDTVAAEYFDQDCDGAPRTVIDEASLDCQPPVISGIAVAEITNESVTIRWDTDEPSIARLRLDPFIPPVTVHEDTHMGLQHEIQVTGLAEDTGHYFAVGAEDAAGNVIEDTNGGNYYEFHTMRAVVAFVDQMEFPMGWTESGDGQWEWGPPLGLGGGLFAGHPDPDADHTTGWGKVWGVDLSVNGNYDANSDCTLLSPQICCSNVEGCRLEFYQWLNLSSDDLIFKDSVTIELSNNNGATWQQVHLNDDGYYCDEWEPVSFDISQWADGQPFVRLRFTLTSHLLFNDSGWNIDDLKVWGYDNGAGIPTPTPTPTWTTGPGTPTYTPLPTRTPSPTRTPTRTPSPPPVTPTPWWSPAPVTPTPVLEQIGAVVRMNQTMFHAGDDFLLQLELWNHGVGERADIYILLEVTGLYWSWPSWCQLPQLDYETLYMPYGYGEVRTILTFTWPTDAGAYSGAAFWGALLRHGTLDLLCQPGMVVFGWE